jgi:hypothetical protein
MPGIIRHIRVHPVGGHGFIQVNPSLPGQPQNGLRGDCLGDGCHVEPGNGTGLDTGCLLTIIAGPDKLPAPDDADARRDNIVVSRNVGEGLVKKGAIRALRRGNFAKGRGTCNRRCTRGRVKDRTEDSTEDRWQHEGRRCPAPRPAEDARRTRQRHKRQGHNSSMHLGVANGEAITERLALVTKKGPNDR